MPESHGRCAVHPRARGDNEERAVLWLNLCQRMDEPDNVFGCMRGEVEIVGDIVSSAVPLEDWEILR